MKVNGRVGPTAQAAGRGIEPALAPPRLYGRHVARVADLQAVELLPRHHPPSGGTLGSERLTLGPFRGLAPVGFQLGAQRRAETMCRHEERPSTSPLWLVGGLLVVGAPEGTRTPNLLIRSQMLYPLSYGRVVLDQHTHWRFARRLRDSNPGGAIKPQPH